MKNLRKDYYNPFFSHIYVEKTVLSHPRTKKIMDRFPKANIIEIDHYKDVFCRRGPKQGNLIYKGAPVCQSFGNENFYYTSCMMNCIYDCEYCYLKGMYPSGNVVVFVNLEDIFDEVQKILKEHAMYLCVSYDTDMLAMERITGYTQEWIHFVKNQKNLTIEIRTKSADSLFWQKHSPTPGIIYGITLSPQAVIDAYEHKTPSLKQRIASAAEAVQRGYAVRLCFDPMIYCPDWEQQYDGMLEQVFSEIDMEKIEDVSIGTFRVSQDYLKKMRKIQPCCAVVQFPYHYSKELTEQMEQHMVNGLRKKVPEDKIFLWEDEGK